LSNCAAFSITGRSDVLPIIMLTTGSILLFSFNLLMSTKISYYFHIFAGAIFKRFTRP